MTYDPKHQENQGRRYFILDAVKAERQRQMDDCEWTLNHDRQHSPSEWMNLVDHYIGLEKYIQAAALCVAAEEAHQRGFIPS